MKKYNNGFKKGDPRINRKGRPRKPEIGIFRDAIEKDALKHKQHLLEYAIEAARKNPVILVAILKKILPDKIEGEGFVEDITAALLNYPEVDAETRRRILERVTAGRS